MKLIPSSVVLKVSRQILVVKKNSPHIFFGLGLAGTVASTVLACRATLKLSDTLDQVKKEIEPIQNVLPAEEFMTTIDHADRIQAYARASYRIGRLYAPSIALGAVSIAMLTGSHVQMARRNTALMAAYAAVQKAYDEYRERVRAQLGDERELELYHATRTEIVKGEDGKDKEVKIADPTKYSPYAKFFDEYSRHWQKDAELNRMFIEIQQNYANQRLIAYGHVFLNEVYDWLGIDRTKAGAVVGWVKEGDGDGYIDFGIFEAFNTAFVNGWERSILLDFNVDGVIYDKI